MSEPIDKKSKYYAKLQEAIRKDVERAFGILQARFSIVANPSRLMDLKDMAKILRCCIILHNMIVDDERDTYKLMTPEAAIAEFDSASSSGEVRRAQFGRIDHDGDVELSPFKRMCYRFEHVAKYNLFIRAPGLSRPHDAVDLS